MCTLKQLDNINNMRARSYLARGHKIQQPQKENGQNPPSCQMQDGGGRHLRYRLQAISGAIIDRSCSALACVPSFVRHTRRRHKIRHFDRFKMAAAAMLDLVFWPYLKNGVRDRVETWCVVRCTAAEYYAWTKTAILENSKWRRRPSWISIIGHMSGNN